jgi:hypothetical protein
MAEAGSENCHSQRSFSSAMPHTHTQQVRTKYKQLRTSVIRTGNQRYIDNTRQPADKINRRFKESRVLSPFDSCRFQRPREVLQVIRTTFTAPRLERRARRMVVPQPQTRARDRSFEAYMLLRLVTHERWHRRTALTRLSAFLRRQPPQTRIHPVSQRQKINQRTTHT